MADTTTVMALPFPEGADANDVPADVQALAERLDEAPGIEVQTRCACCGYDCYQTGRCPCRRETDYAGSPGRTSGHGTGSPVSVSSRAVYPSGRNFHSETTSPFTVTRSMSPDAARVPNPGGFSSRITSGVSLPLSAIPPL
jgi:hypothetical protein